MARAFRVISERVGRRIILRRHRAAQSVHFYTVFRQWNRIFPFGGNRRYAKILRVFYIRRQYRPCTLPKTPHFSGALEPHFHTQRSDRHTLDAELAFFNLAVVTGRVITNTTQFTPSIDQILSTPYHTDSDAWRAGRWFRRRRLPARSELHFPAPC